MRKKFKGIKNSCKHGSTDLELHLFSLLKKQKLVRDI